MNESVRSRVAIACQGGGSHTAFTAGVLKGLLLDLPDDVEIVALSGTSGGALCATLAWDGLLRGDAALGAEKLQAFWDAMAASEPWDSLLNQALVGWASVRDLLTTPEVSPYSLPTWGEDQFRAILNRHFNFEELRALARQPAAPALQIGAVEVLTGHFEIFTGEDLVVECLLASAAIPQLFRAVEIPGRGVYWDGLFSQNPPIHDLTDHDIDELWLIQINPSTCARIPTTVAEIIDRRNELAGNISMEQELGIIEIVNRLVAKGEVTNSRYHHVDVARIPLEQDLECWTKLDRRPEFLRELRYHGRAKARWFLKDRRRRLDAMPQQLKRGEHQPRPRAVARGPHRD